MPFTVTSAALPCNFYFFNLTQPLTISTVRLLYIVQEKGGKPDRNHKPLPYGLRNPYRNLKSENSQDYAEKPQRNCTFMNSALVHQYCMCGRCIPPPPLRIDFCPLSSPTVTTKYSSRFLKKVQRNFLEPLLPSHPPTQPAYPQFLCVEIPKVGIFPQPERREEDQRSDTEEIWPGWAAV